MARRHRGGGAECELHRRHTPQSMQSWWRMATARAGEPSVVRRPHVAPCHNICLMSQARSHTTNASACLMINIVKNHDIDHDIKGKIHDRTCIDIEILGSVPHGQAI